MRNLRQFFLTTLVLLCSALTTWAAYSGTPAEPTQISGNYADYGLSADFDGYYVISTAEELYGFAELVNGGTTSANGVLTANIVVNSSVLTAEGELNGDGSGFAEWTPIGTSSQRYSGIFNGNGHTISGLYFNNNIYENYPNGGKYVGLFGYVYLGTIKNVGLIDSYIHGSCYVGGICGYFTGNYSTYCTIINCFNAGTVATTSSRSDYVIGGICGFDMYCYIYNSYNVGKISKQASSGLGGISGDHRGKMFNCYTLMGSVSNSGGGTFASADQFASGEITYLLNERSSENVVVWRQNLVSNTDAIPTLDNTHGIVYPSSPCPMDYSNTQGAVKSHVWNDSGLCMNCGQYQPAVQITQSNLADFDGLTSDFIGWYAISSTAQLFWFADEVNNGSTNINAVLTADIVVNENVLNDDGTLNGTPTNTWKPIGNSSVNYAGTFDGNGHTVSGLYFNNANTSYVGLFGYCNSSATIKNVGVIMAYINGQTYVGGICGSGGKQINCYYEGRIDNTSGYVGGINGNGGTQTNCYHNGVVYSKSGHVGGICGNGGTQTNCYNTGSITCYYSSSCKYYGGISGDGGTQINCYNTGRVNAYGNTGAICGNKGTQVNCYYLEGIGYWGTVAGVKTATTDEFASGKITYLLNGSVSGGTVWRQNLGVESDALPTLDNSHGLVYITQPCSSSFNNSEETKQHNWGILGKCTACDEYQPATLITESNLGDFESEGLTSDYIGYYVIANAAQLYVFADLVNDGQTDAKGVLVADIVVNENVLAVDGELNGTPTYSWTPIGTYDKQYAGAFDGNNHTISGLYFNNTTNGNYPAGGEYIGLFGYANDAIIKNVGVVDSYFAGYDRVGGICGVHYDGTLINCYNKGTIKGLYNFVGGISGVGRGPITYCYNTGLVKGQSQVGGICGYGYDNIQANCYNTGTITSTGTYSEAIYGGISGEAGIQINCYNTGYISSTGNQNSLGGICGKDGTQKNCYNVGVVSCSGSSSNVGSICSTAGGLQINCYSLINCTENAGGGVLATAEEFESGKITYLLNAKLTGNDVVWRQNLASNVDATPTLDNSHGIVYASLPCYSEFSNNAGNVKQHTWESTGLCSACGAYHSATLITENNLSNYEGLTSNHIGYYAITNFAELYWFADTVNNSGATTINGVLTADIVVNTNVLDGNGELNGDGSNFKVWTPIGTNDNKYEGVFDGNNHTISGLYFNCTVNAYYPEGGNNVGLFGYLSQANIQNLGVIDSYIKGGYYVGGISGSYGTITRCYNKGTISGKYAGGISGLGNIIKCCYNTGVIKGGDAGGICGKAYRIWYCYNTGSVTGTSYVGAIMGAYSGSYDNTNFKYCYYLQGCAVAYNGVQYGAGAALNKKTQDVSGATIGTSDMGFKGGFVARELNVRGEYVWRQTLFADESPVLDATHNSVSGYLTKYDDATIKVWGNVIFASNYEIPEGKTLNVPEGTTLTTTGNAVITNNGTLYANGTVAGNNLAGNGSFIYDQLAATDITFNKDSYTYKSTEFTLADGLDVTIGRVMCGKTFAFDDSKTSVSYENNRNVGNNAKVTWSNTNGSSISKTFSITPKTLTISNIKAENKTYDGNTATTVSYDADVFAVDIDKVTFGTAATFDNKNVGTGKTVSFDYTKSGADANNYAFATTTGTTTANIEQRELVISSTVAAGKVYDGNTTTTVAIAASNIVDGDVVEFGTAAAFDNKNVGTNKDVNFDFTKSGADAANYKFAAATGTVKAAITARSLTLSNFKADSKTYDATTNATGGQFSDDRVIGDMLEFSYNYSFTDKNVETNKDVNFSSIAISGGADKNNYTLATTSGKATADITVKTLNISNIAAANKVYDGNTATSVSYTTDKVATDDVTFGTTATFADKNVGNGKAVSFNYTKSGADAANYAFANESGSTTANIEPRELAISSVSAAGKEYDGNTATTVTIAASNIVSGDVVTFGTEAAFEDKNVGTNKTVNFTYTKSGADANNYKFASETGTAKANITARSLTLSNFKADSKVYDGTTEASGSFSDDRVSGDELEFSYTVEFTNANVAEDVNSVNFSNIAISGGADKDNYSLVTLTGSANANITPVTDEVVVTVAMPTLTVVYNGQGNRYTVSSESDVISCNSELYFRKGSFGPVNNTVFQTYMQNIQLKTDAGEYILGWTAELFENTSPNFSNVTFNVTDGKLIITPKTGVVVTVTENSSEVVYNTEEQSVEGYTFGIDDELGIYSEDDFTFGGTAAVAGTTVGTYPMELSADDFSNTNTNYADVEFVIVDGALTINKAPEAPNKPEATMETRYIVTQLVELPENWKWADEQQALEEGDNTATANYDGADKGNYEIESVDVTINRLPCLHDQGNDVLYKLEPTCTHKGYTGNLSCKLCGKIYQQGDSIPALGHAFDTVTIAATCTAEGYKELTCSRCNHVEHIDFVPANGHKEDVAVFENIVDATCTVAGSKDSVVYCSVCHVELSRNAIVIPAAGHKADSVAIENVVAATSTAVATYDSVIYCSVCKAEISRKKVYVTASSMAVSKQPSKVEYKQGEKLDVKGGKVTVSYSDNSTADFEMLAGWVSGFDSQKVGKQQLTVTFDAVSSTLTATFSVTVKEADDDTQLDEASAEISIYAYNSTIVVEAADAITGEIEVFDVNGRMVVKTLAAGSRTEIQMPRQGLYIVRYGNQAKRVVIK